MDKLTNPQQSKKPVELERAKAPMAPPGPSAAPDKSKGSFFGMFKGGTPNIETGSAAETRPAAAPPAAPKTPPLPAAPPAAPPPVSAGDVAARGAKSGTQQHMIIPEGVLIEGSVKTSVEAEISGRVQGDVSVEGRLFLGTTGLISGNIRAGSCRVEGLVEGKVECSQEIELGRAGRLNADAIAGQRITVAGQVFGNISTVGMLRLVNTCRVEGNIRTKNLVIEEGAVFNGQCMMRAPAQKEGA